MRLMPTLHPEAGISTDFYQKPKIGLVACATLSRDINKALGAEIPASEEQLHLYAGANQPSSVRWQAEKTLQCELVFAHDTNHLHANIPALRTARIIPLVPSRIHHEASWRGGAGAWLERMT
jgi:hypothetical protein